MHTPRRFIAFSAVAALALVGCSNGGADSQENEAAGAETESQGEETAAEATVEPGSGEPLTIMLTNDDG